MAQKKIESTTPGQWKGIETKIYKESHSSSFKKIVRRTLIDWTYPDVDYELRYFEIDHEGYSSFEQHEHTHTVIIAKGEGWVKIGDDQFSAKPLDVFYIPSMEPHQLRQIGHEAFGFFCIVHKERDRPTLLNHEESPL